jgi:Gluconate 2-dehydrogenase subunit 3
MAGQKLFTDQQTNTLKAVVNRIIPPDDWPGGWDAGVGDYLLSQFEGDLAHVLDQYRQGLEALDAEARAWTGEDFAQLGPERQDALLAHVVRSEVQTVWPVDPAAFFHMLVQHCGEGFYADPANGGNRDGIAWHMIGFELRDE